MENAAEWLKNGFKRVCSGIRKAADYAVENANDAVSAVIGAVGLQGAIHANVAMATAPDASTITDTAETTFEAVGAIVVSAVGFFIIVKIVKWIRK